MVHHLPGDLKRKGFAEIYRVLKPGGRLLVVDFEPPSNPIVQWLLRPFLGNMLQIDNRKLLPLFEEAGFKGVEAGKTKHWLASFVRGEKLRDEG